MSENKDPDPFLRSLATLKEILTSPPKESSPQQPARRSSPVGRRRSSSPVPTAATTALRLELEQERKQRQALEKALNALTDSRKTLQTQLDAAKVEAQQKEQAYTALQGEMRELKVKHSDEIKQEREYVSNAKSKQNKAQESVDAAEARVASLELHLQELQDEAKKKEDKLKKVKKIQQEERATMQKNVDVLLADLKKTRKALDESRKKLEAKGKAATGESAGGEVTPTDSAAERSADGQNAVMAKAGAGDDADVTVNHNTAIGTETSKKRSLDDAQDGADNSPSKKKSAPSNINRN